MAILSLCVLVGVVVGCDDEKGAPEPVRRPPPDIVLITVDALRADVLSNAGWPHATTPELDTLAAEGVVLPLAITSYPGTPPSMTSLMTGLFPWTGAPSAPTSRTDHGFSDLHPAPGRFGVPGGLDTLAEILARHGYLTIGFNTNPYLNSPSNFHQGFAEYVEFEPDSEASADIEYHALVGNYAPATFVVDTVLKRLDSPLRRPIFLWIHLMDVHSPYLPPPALAHAFPRRFTGRTDLEVNEALYHEIFFQRGALDAAASYPSYRDLGLTREAFTEHLVGLYEAEVRYADHELGRLFRRLRERSLWEPSLVIVTADHGEELLDHGLVSHHTLSLLEDELIRIPLIVKLPDGAAAGTRVDRLVRMVDIAPTVLDIVGLADQAVAMDGASIGGLLEGDDGEPRAAPIVTRGFAIIRTERWKYVLDWRDPAGERELLFDLGGDPPWREEVSASQPLVTAELRARMDDFRRHLRNRSTRTADQLDVAQEPLLDPATRERLEGLGYLTGDD
jgi:arylsulfatase